MSTVRAGEVVVGVDGSPESDAAVEWAVGFADMHHRPLVLATGAGAPSHLRDSHTARQERRIDARRCTDHALGLVRKLAPGLDVRATTPLVEPAAALLGLSDHASILVVGTRGRGRVGSVLLGSVSAAVSGHATCPVAVVRSAEASDDLAEGPVVVGIDASAESVPALDFAFDIASTEGLSLHVVHNWVPSHRPGHRPSYVDQLEDGDAHQRAMEISLAGYEEKYPDVEVHRHMPRSGPVDTLVVLSDTASLVVVGARAHPGARGVLDSVSRAVVERAHAPVVVVRAAPARSVGAPA